MKQKQITETKKPRKISEFKLKAVNEFENLVKNKRTILVSSIKNIPASQVQEISKKLRGKAIVKVPKKNLIFMGLDFSKDKEIEKLRDNIKENIEIPEGPTELMPGPAVSELSALGIKIQIEKGKITIKEPKIVVKKGEKISQAAAEILSKLDIKPFKIGFIPVCSFDTKEKIFYSEIKIDTEGTIGH